MKRFELALWALLLVFSSSCKKSSKKNPAPKTVSFFESSLEQTLHMENPLNMYLYQYGRFTLSSDATLTVKKNDFVKQFTGTSKLEMDQEGNFILTRRPLYAQDTTSVSVVGTQALIKDADASGFKKIPKHPEFLNWAQTIVAELFLAYDQTDFADSATKLADTDTAKTCYKNATGTLCVDKNTSLPLEGQYRINISGDASSMEHTFMDLDFKISPHPKKSERISVEGLNHGSK